MLNAMLTRVYNANTLRRLEEAKPTSDISSNTMSEVATLFQHTKIKSEREAMATNKNARQYFRPARPAHRVSAKNGANDSISGDERHNIHHNHFAREQTLGQRTDVQSSFNRMGSSLPKSILYTARFNGHP